MCTVCGFEPQKYCNVYLLAPESVKESEGFEETFFEDLFALEAQSFWFQARNELIIWALKKHFKSPRKLLEIGCGTGFVLSGISHNFPQTAITGTEIFVKGLYFATSRVPKADFLQMDARKIPFKEEFNVVCAFDVLEHILEDDRVLLQLNHATEKKGGLLLTVPQHRWLWSVTDEYAHHCRRYSAQELCDKVEKAGFKVIHTTSFVSLLLPVMLLSRLRQKKFDSNYDQTSELRLPTFINYVFELLMGLERTLIISGFSFPIGGSLLLVAQKLDN